MAIKWELSRFGSLRGTVGGLELFVISYNRVKRGDKAVYELSCRLPVRLPDSELWSASEDEAKQAAEGVLARFMQHINAHWGAP